MNAHEHLDDPIWHVPLPGTTPTPIGEHRDGCRWVLGDPRLKAFYCNATPKPGSSYCPEHHALVWRPRPGVQP